MFATVLVANRGEIARRVIRTLDRMGIRAIAVYSPADRHAPHVREATDARAVSSYLDIGDLIAAAEATGAEALHPGYGFLSENPALPRACERAGIAFIGPPAAAGELMGDKLRAKAVARQAGIPVVESLSEGDAASARYPLLVKAAAGGGGRGMRVVQSPDELEAALESARREAQAGFGDARVFIERFIPRARHIEVQVLADSHGNVIHLGERECSLQRRHQKLIEESPSPVVDERLRAALGDEAIALARAAGYVNAGTVEFIADFHDPNEHYFLEMNARLQVEHPVTELVTGLDLVEQQLRIAAGERLAVTQDEIVLTGHAIEARINAEDAMRNFLPTTGRVLDYRRPMRARVDEAIEVGSEVDTTYDSLLAKVIVHGPDRAAALIELDRALAGFTILGVTTTTGFLRTLIATDEVRTGEIDTGLVERNGVPEPPIDDHGIAVAAGMLMLAEQGQTAGDDPFARVDGWRLGGRRAASRWSLAVGAGEPVEVDVPAEYVAMVHPLGDGRFAIDGRGEWLLARDGELTWIGHGGWAWSVRRRDADQAGTDQTGGELRAPMPGQVLLVHARVGAEVRAGDTLVVLESMKMELAMTAPVDGLVTELSVAVGDKVVVDQPLAHVEANGAS